MTATFTVIDTSNLWNKNNTTVDVSQPYTSGGTIRTLTGSINSGSNSKFGSC